MHAILFNHWHAYLPFLMDKALPIISQAGYGQLVKMIIYQLLNHMVYLDQIRIVTYLF